MPDAEPPIRLRGLSKSFGELRAVDGLDLEVNPGEIFGFLGPNGAGKSTTIRMLLDLRRPTSGEVRILGQDPRAAGPELRRRIGYMPGEFIIYDRQSVDDALTGLASLRGGVPRRNIIDLANRLDLNLRRTVRELSKGNRQKVGLVQAFTSRNCSSLTNPPKASTRYCAGSSARCFRTYGPAAAPCSSPRTCCPRCRRPLIGSA
jgi:ABC-2 type transport system ATP-binding protein